MKTKTLGRLAKVDLREYWKREDTHFTPWLGREENISLLGETIGMELEVQGQEANVGPFRADILCRNTADDTLVLIENQLERTDHTHLGQLITYAAGLDAVFGTNAGNTAAGLLVTANVHKPYRRQGK